MMFILQNNKALKFSFSILLCISVAACKPKDPVCKFNKAFLREYKGSVEKARKKNKKYEKKEEEARKKEMTKPIVVISKTKRADLDEIAFKNFSARQSKQEDIDYISHNHKTYKSETVDFDEIKIPRRDIFADKDLGRKDFESVDNKTMQESFDHMHKHQKKREKELKILKLRQEKIKKEERAQEEEKEKKEGESIVGKAKKTVKSLKDKVLELLK